MAARGLHPGPIHGPPQPPSVNPPRPVHPRLLLPALAANQNDQGGGYWRGAGIGAVGAGAAGGGGDGGPGHGLGGRAWPPPGLQLLRAQHAMRSLFPQIPEIRVRAPPPLCLAVLNGHAHLLRDIVASVSGHSHGCCNDDVHNSGEACRPVARQGAGEATGGRRVVARSSNEDVDGGSSDVVYSSNPIFGRHQQQQQQHAVAQSLQSNLPQLTSAGAGLLQRPPAHHSQHQSTGEASCFGASNINTHPNEVLRSSLFFWSQPACCWGPLHFAVYGGDIDSVIALLRLGGRLRSTGIAASNAEDDDIDGGYRRSDAIDAGIGSVPAAESSFSDPNQRALTRTLAGDCMVSPVGLAAFLRRVDVLKILLDAGGRIEGSWTFEHHNLNGVNGGDRDSTGGGGISRGPFQSPLPHINYGTFAGPVQANVAATHPDETTASIHPPRQPHNLNPAPTNPRDWSLLVIVMHGRDWSTTTSATSNGYLAAPLQRRNVWNGGLGVYGFHQRQQLLVQPIRGEPNDHQLQQPQYQNTQQMRPQVTVVAPPADLLSPVRNLVSCFLLHNGSGQVPNPSSGALHEDQQPTGSSSFHRAGSETLTLVLSHAIENEGATVQEVITPQLMRRIVHARDEHALAAVIAIFASLDHRKQAGGKHHQNSERTCRISGDGASAAADACTGVSALNAPPASASSTAIGENGDHDDGLYVTRLLSEGAEECARLMSLASWVDLAGSSVPGAGNASVQRIPTGNTVPPSRAAASTTCTNSSYMGKPPPAPAIQPSPRSCAVSAVVLEALRMLDPDGGNSRARMSCETSGDADVDADVVAEDDGGTGSSGERSANSCINRKLTTGSWYQPRQLTPRELLSVCEEAGCRLRRVALMIQRGRDDNISILEHLGQGCAATSVQQQQNHEAAAPVNHRGGGFRPPPGLRNNAPLHQGTRAWLDSVQAYPTVARDLLASQMTLSTAAQVLAYCRMGCMLFRAGAQWRHSGRSGRDKQAGVMLTSNSAVTQGPPLSTALRQHGPRRPPPPPQYARRSPPSVPGPQPPPEGITAAGTGGNGERLSPPPPQSQPAPAAFTIVRCLPPSHQLPCVRDIVRLWEASRGWTARRSMIAMAYHVHGGL